MNRDRVITNHESRDAHTPATLGVLEWFVPNEHDRVERVLDDLGRLNITHLRTGISWADWHTDGGRAWYDWLLPRLARDVDVLPCVLYTPPSIGRAPYTAAPPREPKAYADFIDLLITDYGRHFQWLELWNEPNNLSEWDWTLDPGWRIFAQMIINAGHWARHRGKRVVLGGASPIDPAWFDVMCGRGVMDHVDAVGIHGFPGTWEATWRGWPAQVKRVDAVLERHGYTKDIWITETGYSTWRHDDVCQVQHFLSSAEAPVQRMYWYAMDDLDPERPTVDGYHSDEREYHFGLRQRDGRAKLLYRLLTQPDRSIRLARTAAYVSHHDNHREPYTLILGGAGFLGYHLARHLLSCSKPVRIFDNLSQVNSLQRLDALSGEFREKLTVDIADVRNRGALQNAIRNAEQIIHCISPPDTTSDMAQQEILAHTTFHLLELICDSNQLPRLLLVSSVDNASSPHCPTACAARYAEDIVLSFARTGNVEGCVLRMGDIYGPHDDGRDRLSITHVLEHAASTRVVQLPIAASQMLDLLYVEDAVNAMVLALNAITHTRGRIISIGGSRLSAAALMDMIQDTTGELAVHFAADEAQQPPAVNSANDSRHLHALDGWSPTIDIADGLARLHQASRTSSGESSTRERHNLGQQLPSMLCQP